MCKFRLKYTYCQWKVVIAAAIKQLWRAQQQCTLPCGWFLYEEKVASPFLTWSRSMIVCVGWDTLWKKLVKMDFTRYLLESAKVATVLTGRQKVETELKPLFALYVSDMITSDMRTCILKSWAYLEVYFFFVGCAKAEGPGKLFDIFQRLCKELCMKLSVTKLNVMPSRKDVACLLKHPPFHAQLHWSPPSVCTTLLTSFNISMSSYITLYSNACITLPTSSSESFSYTMRRLPHTFHNSEEGRSAALGGSCVTALHENWTMCI